MEIGPIAILTKPTSKEVELIKSHRETRICFAVLAVSLCVSPSLPQAQTLLPPTAAQGETRARITAIRDDFVQRTKSSGLRCTLPPPRMEVRPVSYFGAYDKDTNTVATTDWSLLSAEQKTMFFQMVGPGANEDSAHEAFEDTMHRSMLVHELAHWWEACHKVSRQVPLALFQQGVQADRISVAYWRVANPALPGKVAAIAQGLIDHVPSPIPKGQSVEQYFNQNYEKISPSIKPWFGAQLYLAAYREAPHPSFPDALALSSQ